MGEALLVRSGSGGSGGALGGNMNFTVIGGAEQPLSPKENMLWIITEHNVTGYEFDFARSSSPYEGLVWIGVDADSEGAFNALKENELMVYPVDAMQYIGGEWIQVGLHIYLNGAWVEIKADPKAFPAEPTSYTLIQTITTATEWVAPEKGWFQVEVFGASGRGGTSDSGHGEPDSSGDQDSYYAGGGGGGGGGYACSQVQLNAGDVISMSPGTGPISGAVAYGSVSTATITTTVFGLSYDTLTVTSGGNGANGWADTDGTEGRGGTGGVGGIGSGGNVHNATGGNGGTGGASSNRNSATGGAGGAAGYTGGTVGGAGGGYNLSYGYGASGFIKIYRGNTNMVS